MDGQFSTWVMVLCVLLVILALPDGGGRQPR